MKSIDVDKHDVEVIIMQCGVDEELAKKTLKRFGNDLGRTIMYLTKDHPIG